MSSCDGGLTHWSVGPNGGHGWPDGANMRHATDNRVATMGDVGDTRCWAGWRAFYGGRWPGTDPGAAVVAIFCEPHIQQLIADGMVTDPYAAVAVIDSAGVDGLNRGRSVMPVTSAPIAWDR